MKHLSAGVRRGVSVAALAAAAGGWTAPAHAAAFYLADQSTKGLGRAFSGETAERGAQQQWYNPAAIGGITGVQNYVGVTAILPGGSVRPDATSPTTVGRRVVGGAAGKDPVNNGYLPNGGVAIGLGKVALGLTVTSPFSFTTNYDSDFFGRYSADKSRLRTFDIQPSIAFAPNEHLSVGGAVNVEYLRATLSNYLPDPFSTNLGTPATPFPDGHQYLKGDGWDVGYSFGFQYHNDQVDLGASYKSSIRHKLKGKLIIDGLTDPLAGAINQRVDGANADFTTPWQVSVGLRYHFTPAFTLNAQVTRFGWEKFDTIDLSNLGAVTPDQSIVQSYKNSYTYALGADYKLSEKTTLRAGVARDLTPIRDNYRDPRVPDGNRWFFAVGGTHELNDFVGVDFGAAYDKIKSERVDNTAVIYGGTILQTTSTTSGRTHNGHAVLLSLGAHVAM
ncbi:OmpP1/FadL family transporter [Sphingomonas sp.]|uniref:OmpP1/FadL family transporter n=1 Tax=Sphingomonas sp. TaxID=28214 RepID=UPI003B0058BD